MDYKLNHKDLLTYLRQLQAARGVWMALPSEVDRWWRTRSKMQSLVRTGKDWCIRGEGADRAVLACAKSVDGKLVYVLPLAFCQFCPGFHQLEMLREISERS